ncbi:MAG: hypothetical protein U0237_01110 [Thermoleophilia bacterium]
MREALLAEPTLATRVRPDAAPALLAPLVTPPLHAAHAQGVDLILEGFLAHHGTPRQLVEDADTGTRVLAGDYCYASGLVTVAASGDLFVIRALGGLVAVSAGLVAADRRADLPALWLGTMAAIAGPRGPEAEAAFGDALRAMRDGDRTPLAALASALHHAPDLEAVLA